MRREYETTFLSLTSLLGAVEGRFFGANPGNVRTSLGQYLNYKKEVIENIKYCIKVLVKSPFGSLVNFAQPMRLKDFSVLFVIEIPTIKFSGLNYHIHTYMGEKGSKIAKQFADVLNGWSLKTCGSLKTCEW